MQYLRGKAAAWLLMASLVLATAPHVRAADILQCVPYARMVSGVSLYGDAWTWWDQAAGRYDRGHSPRKGAVLAFQPYGPMQLGHVAVVSRILSAREVLIRHANWSAPGVIEEDVLAIDVSDDNDWSEVRVWHTPTGQMGARINPTYGFIYSEKARLNPFTGLSGVRMTQAAETRPTIADDDAAPTYRAPPSYSRATPRLAYADMTRMDDVRTLGDIIGDVKRDARLK